MSIEQVAIQAFRSATPQEQTMYPVLASFLPSNTIYHDFPNRFEAQYPEVVWKMKRDNLRSYERTMLQLQEKMSKFKAGAAEYAHKSLFDVFTPYSEEQLAYYEHVYCVKKAAYEDEIIAQQRLEQLELDDFMED